EIDYSVIRCVVEAWKREATPSTGIDKIEAVCVPEFSGKDLPFEPLRCWRHMEATRQGQPDYYLFSDEALRQLACVQPQTKDEMRRMNGLSADVIDKYGQEISALIRDATSTTVTDKVIECVRALPGQLPRSGVAKLLVGSESERVERFQSHPLYNSLPGYSRVDVTMQVDCLIAGGHLCKDLKGYLVLAAVPPVSGIFHSVKNTEQSSLLIDDPETDFLSHPHPRPLTGPWLVGWALDFHSHFDGDTANRGIVGELTYRYKYCGEQQLAGELAGRWVELLAKHPELPRLDGVIPIPPSTARLFDPVTALAEATGKRLEIPVLRGVLLKKRATRPQKEMTSLAQKRMNVAGAFALEGDVKNKCVLLVDDLFDSGATLCEAARVLMRGGARGIVVLTLTRTIHQDA
ncbi:MAG: HRDC domain-containing protein, partial [Anaerolineae bacterium]